MVNSPYIGSYTPQYTPVSPDAQPDAAASEQKKTKYELYKERLQKEREQAAINAQLALLRENSEYQDRLKRVDEELSAAQTQRANITVHKDGTGRVDSGKKGAWRWLSNGATAIGNIVKGMVGLENDKDGKLKWKKPENALLTVLGIAGTALICSIPGVGQVIGAGLIATGAIGGGIRAWKGKQKLEEAERSGNQAKIDEAPYFLIRSKNSWCCSQNIRSSQRHKSKYCRSKRILG